MAAAGNGYFGPTGDLIVDAMTHGYYWTLSPDRTLDWSISKGPYDEEWASIAQAVNYVGSALSTFSYFANIKFNYLGAYVRPSVAASYGSEINFAWTGATLFPGPNYAGRAFFPDGTAYLYPGQAGDIFFNSQSPVATTPNYGPGSGVFSLFIHEIGHALGLKHPHDDGGTGRPTMLELGLPELDLDLATVMSYQDDFNWNLTAWDPATPMILDVLALQYIYGKNMATNAGDSTHSVGPSNLYGTIWDASGSDTVTAATATEGWLIQLPYAQLSRFVDTRAGYAMPLNETALSSPQTLYWLAGDMEAAVGSNWSDRIIGNDLDNFLAGGGGDDVLVGGGGADVINGGAGSDTAVYVYDRNDYVPSRNPINGDIEMLFKGGPFSQGLREIVRADVELLEFRDDTINTASLGYWGTATPPPSTEASAVYRFLNTTNNAFFYSSSKTERDQILANSDPDKNNLEEWPFVYQGSTFEAAHTYSGSVQIHRFYNTQTGHHFFTANAAEAATVQQMSASGAWPFVYEGVGFNVYAADPTGGAVGQELPVHRFFSASFNRHFFTGSQAEIDLVRATGVWSYEGIAFWGEALG